MKKRIVYELTEKERNVLTKCYEEVAVNCEYDCEGCPFKLVGVKDDCLLEKLKEIVEESE